MRFSSPEETPQSPGWMIKIRQCSSKADYQIRMPPSPSLQTLSMTLLPSKARLVIRQYLLSLTRSTVWLNMYLGLETDQTWYWYLHGTWSPIRCLGSRCRTPLCSMQACMVGCHKMDIDCNAAIPIPLIVGTPKLGNKLLLYWIIGTLWAIRSITVYPANKV